MSRLSVVDFEIAPAKVLRELFEGVDLTYCLFHFAQNLVKNLQKRQLTHIYGIPEARVLLRSLIALPMLPPAQVIDGFQDIVAAMNALVNGDVVPANCVPHMQGECFKRSLI